MPSASKPLYDLQEIEARLESEKASLHAVEQRLKSSPQIESARTALSKHQADRDAAQKAIRALERRAEETRERVAGLTRTLYGGSIHDSREMASMEAEIAHAKSNQSRVEDEEIELMERLEHFETGFMEASGELDRLVAEREGVMDDLQAEREARVGAIKELEATRAQATASIEPAALASYRRIRDRTGRAVSRVESGVCQWCRVQLPPKDIQHARGDTLVLCTNCGRILYAD